MASVLFNRPTSLPITVVAMAVLPRRRFYGDHFTLPSARRLRTGIVMVIYIGRWDSGLSSASMTSDLHIAGDVPTQMLFPSISSIPISVLMTVGVAGERTAITSAAVTSNGRALRTSGSRCCCVLYSTKPI